MLEASNSLTELSKPRNNLSQKKKRKRKAKMNKKQKPIPSSTVCAPRSFRRRMMLASINDSRKVRLEKSLPSVFSFIEDKESVLQFLNEAFDYYKHMKLKIHEKRYNYDLTAVTSIDITAICLFLSLINKINTNGIGSRGNYPDDETAKDILINSGFADIMQTAFKPLKTKKYNNQLYIVGSKRVDNKKIGQSVKEAVGYLTGVERHFQPIYTMLIEICSNSVEHANKKEKDKNWVVSVSYEKDRVNFIVVDTGEGIMRTIHRKLPELFYDKVFREDGDVLEDLLNKEYQSRTQEINRHKGLPKIKENFEAGYVDNMKILTNKVWYDMVSKTYEKTTNEYFGVLYSWSFTKDNYQRWENKKNI